jgi:hypothetical protein
VGLWFFSQYLDVVCHGVVNWYCGRRCHC